VEPVDDSIVFVAGEFGTVLKTSDGGTSWRTLPNLSQVWTITAMASLGGERVWCVDESGSIQFTSDGGEHWSTALVDRQGLALADVAFVDAGHGWAAGRGGLFNTADSGRSWTRAVEVGSEVSSVDFADLTQGWCANGRRILRTEDGGASWRDVTPDSNSGAEWIELAAVDERTVWALGANERSRRSVVAKSVDGGAHWTIVLPGRDDQRRVWIDLAVVAAPRK
jgi:photosystem II stability/assembly factor-like uncharacterized protein